IREKVSTSIDMPLSNECKRILAYSAEEADRLNQRHTGTEHLLLGILREEQCLAAQILFDRGLRLNAIRDELKQSVIDRQTLIKPKGRSLPEAGAVPEADTAIRIAEAIWRPLYGAEAIEKQKPIQAELQHGSVWLVTGTPVTEGANLLSARIAKEDGRI